MIVPRRGGTWIRPPLFYSAAEGGPGARHPGLQM